MIGIHPVHRKLAEIIFMCTDRQGNIVVGVPEMQLMMPLLRQNMLLVQRLDELKNLAFMAYEANDTAWMHELSAQIDQLEAQMI